MMHFINSLKSVPRDMSLSAVIMGFVCVMVGYLSTIAVIFQAAESSGASAAQINSWIGALGIGMGITTIGLTLYFRAPIVTAWSTPGAALLVTSAVGVPMQQIIGAFIVSSLLIVLCGVTGWFERVLDRIPKSIAAAMLSGILLQFGMNVFVSMEGDFQISVSMFVCYLVMRQLLPQYTILLCLIVGLLVAWLYGFRLPALELLVTRPVFVVPHFNWQSLISIAIPLFAVTMASQNVPGVATLRAAGYQTRVSPIITWTGFTSLLLAPFGCIGLNLAAITAALCMGPDAHADKDRRYVASLFAGGFYLVLGFFGATVGALLIALPEALVLTVAGLALFATIASSLKAAMQDDIEREPALITFLVTASGVTLFGIGAALWGLFAGVLALMLARFMSRKRQAGAS